MSLYYNLTVLTFKNGCNQLVEKAEYVSECLYNLQDCCKSAISETIHHFDKCENDTKYICGYKDQPLNDSDCMNKNEYSLEDLDDEEEEYP